MRNTRMGVCVGLWAALILSCEGTNEVGPGSTAETPTADVVLDAGQRSRGEGVFVAPDPPDEDVQRPSECEEGGCFGDPCEENDDCFSGLCGAHMGDSVCTETCEDQCPSGWSCQQVAIGGSDPSYLCVSTIEHLCKPCLESDDCASASSQAACVDYGNDGLFCGAGCEVDEDCPEGFVCSDSASDRGGLSRQCVITDGVCACSAMAVELGLSTRCVVSGDLGECEGVRTCTADGLSPCDAPVPAEETCNGFDDDCDGEVDEEICDDGNPCTVDSCEGEAGCVYTDLVETPCDDGDACTDSDTCAEGLCAGEPVSCDDTNVCTDDACDALEGCVNVPNFADCDDGEPCTMGDTCKVGSCAAGNTVSCDDGNPCTVDLCNGDTGCVYEETDDGCDDGNACTVGDSCVQGLCKGLTSTVCDDDNGCTWDTCDPLTGCLHTAHAEPCDDGDVCTLGDVCAEGTCGAGSGSLICDDGNPCTADLCDPAQGCLFTAAEGDCSDGSDCTVDDACVEGACVGAGVLACDDGNPCTEDSCLADGGCASVPKDGPCFDGDLCTVGDTCLDGVCVAGEVQGCDDGNPCTDDSCTDEGICAHVPSDIGCDDGNACTLGDQCVDGACVGSDPVSCDDQNPCTTDACDPVVGCSQIPNALACDDLDACTVGDTCLDGACVSGAPQDCDDGNPCTSDSCTSAGICDHVPAEGGCDDKNACTQADQCVEGACVGTELVSCDDQNVCTTDACDPFTGCSHTPNALVCDDDDACTVGDGCVDGACVSGAPPVCDDGNGCTDDSCDTATGCVFSPNTAACDDGSVCTTQDGCVDGACVGTDPLDCDDQALCTTDACDAADGCVYEFNNVVCDDGSVCTQVDVCEDGVCAGKAPLVCDDNNPCTDDPCDVTEGCTHTFTDGTPCDDDNPDTQGDNCDGVGGCGGTPYTCEPTQCDLTSTTNGEDCDVVHKDATVPCDDEDPSTVEDACDGAGGCEGTPPVCGDGAQEGLEACDDANTDTEACSYGEESCTVCDATCLLVPGEIVGYCGDGVEQASFGETCDDGNDAPGDGCSDTCLKGTGQACGDDLECASARCKLDWDGEGTFCAADGSSCVDDDGDGSAVSHPDGWVECDGGDGYRICSAGTWSPPAPDVPPACGAGTCDAGCGYVSDEDNACVSGPTLQVDAGCELGDLGSGTTCVDCGGFTAVVGGCNTTLDDCSVACGAPCQAGDVVDSGVDVCWENAEGDGWNRFDVCGLQGGVCSLLDDGHVNDTLATSCHDFNCHDSGQCWTDCAGDDSRCNSGLQCLTNGVCAVGGMAPWETSGSYLVMTKNNGAYFQNPACNGNFFGTSETTVQGIPMRVGPHTAGGSMAGLPPSLSLPTPGGAWDINHVHIIFPGGRCSGQPLSVSFQYADGGSYTTGSASIPHDCASVGSISGSNFQVNHQGNYGGPCCANWYYGRFTNNEPSRDVSTLQVNYSDGCGGSYLGQIWAVTIE